ncbi:MAG TPA: hypothetical protein VKN63_05365 [Afifellaceae bacterium]|nr:hypothetical protein [Afifellaceae bacterium]
MRIKSVTVFLSLAILAGITFSANAQVAGGPNGHGGNRGGMETADRGAGDAESINRLRDYCDQVGVSTIDCPKVKKIPVTFTPKEDDCQCKPVAMKVGGKTRIVLDCYQTKLYNNIKRTYVCTKEQ